MKRGAVLTSGILIWLALASQVQAAFVGAGIVGDGDCGSQWEFRYDAATGERNDVQFSGDPGISVPFPVSGPGGGCRQVTPRQVFITDFAAPISVHSFICRSLAANAAVCAAKDVFALRVRTYDQRDLVKVGPNNPEAAIHAGAGSDAVNTANGNPFDSIICGPGTDGATGDVGDVISADCETVTRLP